jgi:hypothetical protein
MKILFFLAAMLLATGIMASVLMANIALELDGSSAIEVPDSDSLNPKKAITIEAWMKMETGGGECLAKDWGGKRDYIFPEIVQNGNGLRFVLWPGTKILDAPGFKLNEWVHAAGVWDGKEMRTYINGKEMGKVAYDAGELNASEASLYIGVGDSEKWTCKGLIDEIRIWEVARTEKEINDSMGKMLAGDEPGLNAYYSFEEKNAKDNTKNKNDGKVAFGQPKYVDVTGELALEPVITSVNPKDKLTNTWAKVKQMQ